MKTLVNSQKRGGAAWWRRGALLMVLLLVLALGLSFAAEPALSPYDSLRLYTEALAEIAQKYVFVKSDQDLIYGSIRGMMNSLDPNSSFLTPAEYQSYRHGQKPAAEAGIDMIIKDNLPTVVAVLDNGPGAQAGLQPGDHVFKINGEAVRNLTTQEVLHRFQGAPGTALKLQVMRNNLLKPLEISVVLQPIADITVSSTLLHDSYGYVRIRYFNDTTPKELAIALKSLAKQGHPLRGLILDLRNNARGSLQEAVRTAALFLGDKEVVTVKGRTPESLETFHGRERDLVWKVPLPTVVLVDHGTAQAAEIMAAALHDEYRSALLGAKTSGLCGLTKVLPLQDGSALVMTVAECYTPRGEDIQNAGLKPEIKGKTPKSQEISGNGLPLPKAPPEQDPWVQQAVEVLKGGLRAQAPHQPKG